MCLTHRPNRADNSDNLYNFSVSNNLFETVNFPILLCDPGAYSSAILELFLLSDTRLSSLLVISLLGNADHVFVFPLTFLLVPRGCSFSSL